MSTQVSSSAVHTVEKCCSSYDEKKLIPCKYQGPALPVEIDLSRLQHCVRFLSSMRNSTSPEGLATVS